MAWNRLRKGAELTLFNKNAGNIIAISNKSQNASAHVSTVSWHQTYRGGISEEGDLAATYGNFFLISGVLDKCLHESSDSMVPLRIIATIKLNEETLEMLPNYMTIQLMTKADIY